MADAYGRSLYVYYNSTSTHTATISGFYGNSHGYVGQDAMTGTGASGNFLGPAMNYVKWAMESRALMPNTGNWNAPVYYQHVTVSQASPMVFGLSAAPPSPILPTDLLDVMYIFNSYIAQYNYSDGPLQCPYWGNSVYPPSGMAKVCAYSAPATKVVLASSTYTVSLMPNWQFVTNDQLQSLNNQINNLGTWCALHPHGYP